MTRKQMIDEELNELGRAIEQPAEGTDFFGEPVTPASRLEAIRARFAYVRKSINLALSFDSDDAFAAHMAALGHKSDAYIGSK